MPRVELTLGGQWLELLPQRAVWWPAQRTIMVADVHLGKAAALAAGGLPLREDTAVHAARADCAALLTLVEQTDAARLLILGDLVHAERAKHPGVVAAFADLAARLHARSASPWLVVGNHDARSGDLPESWRLTIVPEGITEHGLTLRHHPPADGEAPGPTLCGHLHPAVVLGERAGPGARAACFWLRSDGCLVLPPFGRFTGARRVELGRGDRVFVVPERGTPGPVLEVPAGLVRA